MPYTIYKSDGSILTTLADEKIDTESTSVTLIGKNFSEYGQYYNNTIVSLVENFSSSQQPDNPLVGQLWYDKATGFLNVFTQNNEFESIIPNISSPIQPPNAKIGDLWIDTTTSQLKFKSTQEQFLVAGPIYTAEQGRCGFDVVTVLDNTEFKFPHDVVVMYKNDFPIAAISDEGFDLDPGSYDLIPGITSILPGIVLNPTIPNSPKFVGVASSAVVSDSTVNFNGTISLSNIPPIFLTNFDGENATDVTTGTLTIANNAGLSVGINADVGIRVDSSSAYVVQNTGGNSLKIQGRESGGTYYSGLTIVAVPSRRVGILTDEPADDVDINGNTIVRGNLTILGSTTYVTSNDLRVNDKTIELNYSDNPVTDSMAEGGGLVLKGSTDHTLTWTQSFDGSWQSNDNFNLESSISTYKIGGQDVLSQDTLAQGITDAPGLERIGTLQYLTVTNILMTGTTISTLGFDQELILAPANSGPVNVTFHKITNLSTCTNALDAANKSYVDETIFQARSRFSFTIDETNIPDPTDIIPYLNKIFPIVNIPPYDPFNIPDGSVARVLCGTSVYTLPATAVDPTNKTFVTINGISVLQDVNFQVPETNVTVTTTYVVREFLVQNGEWTYVGVI
jgi:hypothetical protein